MSSSGRLLVAVCLVPLLAACTTDPASDDARPSRPSSAATSDDVEAQTERAPLRCEQPSEALVEEAAVAIAPHPGPTRAATLVRAARTGTGTWYVIGIDRTYVQDHGTTNGGASRSLALTNAPAGPTIIPIGDGNVGPRLTTSWEDVSWSGDRLDAGKRALRKAVDCLDSADRS